MWWQAFHEVLEATLSIWLSRRAAAVGSRIGSERRQHSPQVLGPLAGGFFHRMVVGQPIGTAHGPIRSETAPRRA